MIETAKKSTPSSLPEAGTPATPPATHNTDDPKTQVKTIDFEGYKFELDSDLLDDVELLEMIDGIENGERPALIITLLQKLIGDEGYQNMKAYFVKKDGRFKMSKLSGIYQAIFEDFDPKD